MTQPTLFDAPAEAPRISFETRRAAFDDIVASGAAESMQGRILTLIRERGPLTRAEIMALTGIPLHVVSARVCELHDRNVIHEAGKKLNPLTNKHNTSYAI